MEFFVVVLIFITCMIALALLIYYCQEKRNPKYSFTNNQKAISAVALSIGMPGLPSDIFQPNPYASTVVPYPAKPPPPGFMASYPQPSPIPDDELSDSGSSTSSKIYFAPNTAAYSVAKRMSIKTKMERRMSGKPQAISYIPADPRAYLLATSVNEKPHHKGAFPLAVSPQLQKNRISLENPASLSNGTKNKNVAESSDTENVFRRSVSPYIPASVVAFHAKNKSRSESPYTPLRSEDPTAPSVESENSSFKRSASPSFSNKDVRGYSPIRSESLPPKKSASQKQSESLPKRSGSLPPKRGENFPLRPSDSSYSERFPFACSEVEYRSHSPTPLLQLHTVHEEHSE